MSVEIAAPVAVVVAGYLLGSIPTAYIVAKLRKGIDIRDVDVGNVGAGAVFRQLGIWEGAVVLIGDVGKGAAAVLIAGALDVSQPWVLAAGFAALLGHSFPAYIGLRGGQGVATLIGIFLVLTPAAMAVTLVVIGAVLFSRPRLFFDRLFFGAVCAAPVLPLAVWVFQSGWLALYALALAVFVALRNWHRLGTPRTLTSVRRNGGTMKSSKQNTEAAPNHGQATTKPGNR